ncbi:protein FAM81A-like [Octopus sinensis]|uniref:Protein FAM81A-like n=1 Tax=Octopus sinensis TaxID=2607531 RepID=A0A7E6FID6_9MOLL|nr:protein FAM81A-like [Octopus sinensis]
MYCLGNGPQSQFLLFHKGQPIDICQKLRMNAPQLPPIGQAHYSHYQGISQLDTIEGRLQQQERLSEVLINQALKIKEEILQELRDGSGAKVQPAKLMLKEHIAMITNVVNSLNHDIQKMEKKIGSRDYALSESNKAIKSLEIHHAKSLTDLKARIVRCDSSIAKLNSIQKQCNDAIKFQTDCVNNLEKELEKLRHETEYKLLTVSGKLDKNSTAYQRNIESIQANSNLNVSNVETKTQMLFEEIKTSLESQIRNIENDVKNLDLTLMNSVRQENNGQLQHLYTIEEKWLQKQQEIEQQFKNFEKKLSSNEKSLDEFKHSMKDQLNTVYKQLQKNMDHWKEECRSGFLAVHEGLSNMDKIVDGKCLLMEQLLRKEISQIRKMVVLM